MRDVLRRIAGPAMLLLGLATALAVPARADQINVTIDRTVSIHGGFVTQTTIDIPAFSGPGTLTAVKATLAITDFSLEIYTNAQDAGGTITDLIVSAALTVTSPSVFPIPFAQLNLYEGPDSIGFVDKGRRFLALIPGQSGTGDITITTDLARYLTGPFTFTFDTTGGSSGTTSPDVSLEFIISISGLLTVDYVAEFDGTPGTTVPEPAGLTLFGLGLAGMAAMRRRRRP